MNLSGETSTENPFSRSDWYVPLMDKLTGGFMMSLMQSCSADTWAAGAKKADKQHRDTARMAEIEVFVVIVFSLSGWAPAVFEGVAWPQPGWPFKTSTAEPGMMALLPQRLCVIEIGYTLSGRVFDG